MRTIALGRAAVTDLRGKITAADRAVMTRLSAANSPVLDRAMPTLSRAANYSRLWMGIAAGLAASENKWGRRAALRGVASIAIASATTNVLGKRLAGRLRPASEVPLPRRLSRVPRSTSFPSGHAASAAAFATGVALELPVLAVPVGALAAAVGASRVVTGVHFPSDVVAGFAIGITAGLLTVRWWPLRQSEPAAAARPRREAPAAPTGEGLAVVMNCAAADRRTWSWTGAAAGSGCCSPATAGTSPRVRHRPTALTSVTASWTSGWSTAASRWPGPG
jgi:membrane-associated phospholipid phosphatase